MKKLAFRSLNAVVLLLPCIAFGASKTVDPGTPDYGQDLIMIRKDNKAVSTLSFYCKPDGQDTIFCIFGETTVSSSNSEGECSVSTSTFYSKLQQVSSRKWVANAPSEFCNSKAMYVFEDKDDSGLEFRVEHNNVDMLSLPKDLSQKDKEMCKEFSKLDIPESISWHNAQKQIWPISCKTMKSAFYNNIPLIK